jgi:hypothetical protein
VNYDFESQWCDRGGIPPRIMVCMLFSCNYIICERKYESTVGFTLKNVQATFHHVSHLSGNGREEMGGKGDTTEIENETSGTGLTTTQKMGVYN